MKFKPKLYFKIRSYITSKVLTQLEVTDTNFRLIHEDNRSWPNDTDQKSKVYAKWMSTTYKIS